MATHVAAHEQAAFMRKSADEKMLEIWLNGRETNGNVATAIRDIRELKRLEPRVATIERWQIRVMAVVAAALFSGPGVFWLLSQKFG